MKIVPTSEAATPLKSMDSAHFIGQAGSRDLIPASPSTPAIHVIEGEGWVQVRGQDPVRVRAEATVIAEPGEEHWHGAGRRGPMAHIAVAFGDTRWLEASPEPPE